MDEGLRKTLRKEAHAAAERIALEDPTPEEARNGWTAESLRAYRIDQAAAQAVRIDPRSPLRRTPAVRGNCSDRKHYRPLRWKG